MKQLTPEFKAVVAFLLIVAAFALVGFNQLALNKEVNLATQQSNAALQVESKTVSVLKTIVTTPTVIPTASPAATRISTPASATKALVK